MEEQNQAFKFPISSQSDGLWSWIIGITFFIIKDLMCFIGYHNENVF